MQVSPRRLHGWEPLETHRGYDRDGNQVPLAEAFEIVIEREPEWSDADRAQMLGYQRYAAEVGPCGYHHSLTTNTDNVFQPTTSVCTVCAGMDRENRRLQAEDEKARRKVAGKDGNVDPLKPDPADGRHVYMRLLPPDEAAEKLQRAKEDQRGN